MTQKYSSRTRGGTHIINNPFIDINVVTDHTITTTTDINKVRIDPHTATSLPNATKKMIGMLLIVDIRSATPINIISIRVTVDILVEIPIKTPP